MHIPDTIYFDSLIVVNFLNGGAHSLNEATEKSSIAASLCPYAKSPFESIKKPEIT